MITDALLAVFFGLVDLLFSPLGLLHFNFDIAKLEPVLQYFRMALYLIPFQELSPIFIFFIAMMAFRVVISVVKTIWNLLPIV